MNSLIIIRLSMHTTTLKIGVKQKIPIIIQKLPFEVCDYFSKIVQIFLFCLWVWKLFSNRFSNSLLFCYCCLIKKIM